MTPEELRQLIELYGSLQMVPGKTAAQRVNLLQDVGFNPFGRQQQFVEEQFIGEPEPQLVNPVASAYGQDEGWREVFRRIESGMDPDSAVSSAMKDNVFKQNENTKAGNPYEIAQRYALKEAENEAIYNQWAARNQNEAAIFGERQNRLRSEFEAEQPFSIQDLTGVSQFEAMGAPTVDELMARRAETTRQGRASLNAARNAPGVNVPKSAAPRGSGRQGSPSTAVRAPQVRKDIFDNPVLAKALRSTLEGRLSSSKKRILPTERTGEALRTLALVQMLGE